MTLQRGRVRAERLVEVEDDGERGSGRHDSEGGAATTRVWRSRRVTRRPLLLSATIASFDVVNLVSDLVYVVALPFAAIATTYLYFDLPSRKEGVI